jgi:hypothetical protein
VTDIEGKIILGFKPQDIEKALNGMRVTRETFLQNIILDPFDQ